MTPITFKTVTLPFTATFAPFDNDQSAIIYDDHPSSVDAANLNIKNESVTYDNYDPDQLNFDCINFHDDEAPVDNSAYMPDDAADCNEHSSERDDCAEENSAEEDCTEAEHPPYDDSTNENGIDDYCTSADVGGYESANASDFYAEQSKTLSPFWR